MTTIFLIRHAETGMAGKVMAGRLPGIHLNQVGITQAATLAVRLTGAGIRAIYSSPLDRARETAQPLAARLGLEIVQRDALLELDFGEWTGQSLEELDRLAEWQLFNSFRSGTRPPGGELMLEVQTRIVSELTDLWRRHPGEAVAVVSHADVIRAAVIYYAGAPLDLFHRFEISPASVTILRLDKGSATLLRVNDTGES